MKINPISNQNMLQIYRTGKTKAPEKVRNKSSLDQISISDEALSFSKTFADIKESMEVRSAQERAHVDEIKEKVRQGSYHVDSNLVAEKILRNILSE